MFRKSNKLVNISSIQWYVIYGCKNNIMAVMQQNVKVICICALGLGKWWVLPGHYVDHSPTTVTLITLPRRNLTHIYYTLGLSWYSQLTALSPRVKKYILWYLEDANSLSTLNDYPHIQMVLISHNNHYLKNINGKKW